LWATLYSGGIVKTTPSGQMTIYVTPHGAVKNIAAGPDGNLWFTEHDANLFGRITTDGSITEYPLDDIGVPNGIRAGPDGRLWICEQGEWTSSHVTPGRIVRVDTNGQIYGVYPLAPKAWQNVPEDIAVGKYQKLWFTEFYAPSQVTYYISSINQNGKIHEYLTLAGGGQYAGPGVPTLAADGNIWFSEEYAGQLGRVTSSGKITEFPLPQGSGSSYTFPYGVATDASGHNIWFADWQNKRLGLFAI
jgi:virginiamycin B lyase